MPHDESINELIAPISSFGDLCITKNSSLFGGVSLSGIDPVGTTNEKVIAVAELFKAIVQILPESATLYQYYSHNKGVRVSNRDRDYSKSDALVKRREEFLNKQDLSTSSITHLIELPTSSNLNKLSDISFISNLFSAIFDKQSRQYIKNSIYSRNATLIQRGDLENTAHRLINELKQYKDKLGLVSFDNKMLDGSELWHFLRYLYNLDKRYLANEETPPLTGWDHTLVTGEISPVTILGTRFLKIEGAKTIYARIGSVINYGGEETPLAAFSSGDQPAILSDGNYIIAQKWRPYSRIKKAKETSSRQTDINRKTVKVTSMVTGDDATDESRLTDHHRDMLKELQEVAARDDIRLGVMSSKVIVFDENPDNVNKYVEDINIRLSSNGLQTVWESASLKEAFRSILPSDEDKHPRHHTKNSSHVGALASLYQTSQGQPKWLQTGIDEEVLINLQTIDNKVFGFNPFVGGKCVVLCVGPIRSGKSFTRATFASHNTKYGGYHLSVDVDSGSESLVDYFSEISSLFKITDDPNSGFNLLGAARDLDDKTFIEHFYQQIELLLKLNSSDELRKLTTEEQADIDMALSDLLAQPKENQTLSNLIVHLQTNAEAKLSRFKAGNILGNFFDSKTDKTASINTRLSAFNLEAIKDNEKILPIVMSELFFRANRLFEDPSIRTVPKILDIDEGHVLLGMPDAGAKIISAARRIGKYFGGIWMWSQSPEEYRKCEGWDALRTAASALIFMPDSEMNDEEYKLTFKLTDGECRRIAKLTPKKQFYLVQRDLGVSTVINLNVDSAQFVINAAQAMEKEIRAKAFAKYPNDIEKALQEAAKNMGLKL
ncbi:VirB4 family type IV secretion system protein [Pseudoalteromonas nigrifaciens]|uniref:VirB4 family type IV secretion system protein n=1 Tax=Pseudoalteromonas nigrifaciens TaxID=28109 RepID=UPI003FD15C9C